jgi:lysophospholipase L1-like esterase
VTSGPSPNAEPTRRGRRLALLLGGTLLALALLEVLARALSSHPRLLFEPDPSVIWRLAPGRTGVPRPGLPPATVDAEGWRRGGEVSAGAEVRVVVAGDSVTFGWGVADGEAYPALLERTWSAGGAGTPLRVLNAGVPGYAVWQVLKVLDRETDARRPRGAVLALTTDDFYRSGDPGEAERRSAARRIRWTNLAKRSEVLGFVRERLLDPLLRTFRVRRWTMESRAKVPFETVWGSQAGAISEALDRVRARGTIPVLAALPERRIEEDPGDLAARLGELASAKGVGFANLYPRMRREGRTIEAYFLEVDGHPTPLGHVVIAEAIGAALEEAGVR